MVLFGEIKTVSYFHYTVVYHANLQ